MPSQRPLPLARNALRHCSAPGCQDPRVQGSASHYCPLHRYRFKHFGHPLQTPHAIREVRRWESEVRVRIFNRVGPQRRKHLADTAVAYCKPFHAWLRSAASGGEFNSKYGEEAAERLLRVFDNVDPMDILTRITAVYLMREKSPWQFRSDEAFEFAVVRAVRKLTSTSDGSYWNPKTGKVKHIVKPIPRRTVALMGTWLQQWAVEWVSHTNRVAAQLQEKERLRQALANDIFGPISEKLRVEHGKAERKLQLAQSLVAQRASEDTP
jgi:hypothetical protein